MTQREKKQAISKIKKQLKAMATTKSRKVLGYSAMSQEQQQEFDLAIMGLKKELSLF